MKTKIILSICLLLISLTGFSTVWIISNSNNTFTPSTITINLGDTVNFAVASYHNAQEVSQKTWNDNGNTLLTGGFETPFGGGLVLPGKLGVGTHYFVCKPHATFGMKGTITVQATTAISENKFQPNISVFPNPASDIITIKALSNTTGITFVISDLTGRQVLNGKLNNENTSLDISHLLAGLYFLQVGEQKRQTIKLIKR